MVNGGYLYIGGQVRPLWRGEIYLKPKWWERVWCAGSHRERIPGWSNRKPWGGHELQKISIIKTWQIREITHDMMSERKSDTR